MTAGMGLVGISLLLSLGLAAMRIPIAYAVLAGAAFGIYLLYSVGDGGFDASAGVAPLLTILADVPYSFAHSYELATIPLYILLGHVCAAGRHHFRRIHRASRHPEWNACGPGHGVAGRLRGLFGYLRVLGGLRGGHGACSRP